MNKDWLTEPAHADEARLADTRDTTDTVCGMVTVAKIRHRTRYHHTRDPNTAGHTKPVTNPSPECRFVLVSFLDVNIVISPVDV